MIATKMPLRLAAGAPRVYAQTNALARPTVNFVSRRTYATPGRPKTAVGEPTKTVKRAVKRVASEKNTTIPAAKSTKPKKLPKEKEPLTEEQEAKLAKKARIALEKVKKAEINELKEKALVQPKDAHSTRSVTAWAVFNGEKSREAFAAKDGAANSANRPQDMMKVNSQAYKELSPAEREHYNHLAIEISTKRQQNYDAWLKSYTPDQIRLANIARRRLRALNPTRTHNYADLKDDRQVKHVKSPWTYFFSERQLSGDFKHIKVPDAAKLIGLEWKALTEAEKQKYTDLWTEDRERYIAEHQQVYGYPAQIASASTSPEAVEL